MLTYSGADFFRPLLDAEGIPVECVGEPRPLPRIRKVCAYIRSRRPDAVISFMDTPNFLACLAKGRGRRFVLAITELAAMESTFRPLKYRIFKLFAGRADFIVCNSEAGRALWQKHYPRLSGKLRVIYNPVTLKADEIKAAPRSGPGTVFTVAASFQKLKNPDGLLTALSLIPPEIRKGIRIDWYGRTRQENGDRSVFLEAEKRARELGLDGCVNFGEAVTDIAERMLSGDYCALFSHTEGLPNALCEGMALGLPLVMSRVSDYNTLSEGNGFLCDSHDPQSIADAICAAAGASPDQRAEMGRISREKAERLFSPRNIARSWLELITSKRPENAVEKT